MGGRLNTFNSNGLARNVVWNFVGLSAPMLVAIFVIPALIEAFGKERFGLLALIWSGIGYFSLFDMGIGRALTKLISERLGKKHSDHRSLIWTALFLITSLGVAGGVVVGLSAEFLVSKGLDIDPTLQKDATNALRLLAVGLPFVVASSALIGILEAHQRFFAIAAVRVPLGVLMFATPLATAQISSSLTLATSGLLAIRMVAFFAYFFTATKVSSELKKPLWPQATQAAPLFKFGGWLTVTNIVGPLMVYFDRFVVGAMGTMTAVTYYVTPSEVLSRIMILPLSVINVFFPAMTMAINNDRERLTRLYQAGSGTLLYILSPIIIGIFLLAPEALNYWLGEDFKDSSTPVVHWLALGYLINSCAFMPLTVLQSAGRPDIVAKVHLLELLPYFVLLWFLTRNFGIAGTAAAWSLRVFVDTIVLNIFTYWFLPELRKAIMRTLIITLTLPVIFFFLSVVTIFWQKILIVTVVSAVSIVLLGVTLKYMSSPKKLGYLL